MLKYDIAESLSSKFKPETGVFLLTHSEYSQDANCHKEYKEVKGMYVLMMHCKIKEYKENKCVRGKRGA